MVILLNDSSLRFLHYLQVNQSGSLYRKQLAAFTLKSMAYLSIIINLSLESSSYYIVNQYASLVSVIKSAQSCPCASLIAIYQTQDTLSVVVTVRV